MLNRMFRCSFLLLFIGLFFVVTFSVNGQKVSANIESSDADVRNEFVQIYKEVSTLTAPERKVFFRNASPKNRSNLWKTHLAFFFVKNPNLNNEQKNLILETIAMSTAELFEISNNSDKEVTLQLLSQRALGVFTKKEASEIFGNLGGEVDEIKLLQNYQDISAFSISKRKAMFRNASAKDRSNLWRVHLALYLASQPDFSVEQKELLTDVISFITPELYQLIESDSESKTNVESSAELLTKRALVVFSRQEAAKIFTILGLGSKNEQTNCESSLIDVVPIDVPPGGSRPDCNCHRGIGDMCRYGCIGTNCVTDSWGCGLGWILSCTGTECSPG